jgi:hypothetical protein
MMPVFSSENTKSNHDPNNLLWLLDDKYLKEPQAKESLSPQDKQILSELAKSKIPTICTAEFSVKEYMKRSWCTLKDNDSIKVVRLRKYYADSPPIGIKGDLVWTVEAVIWTTPTHVSDNFLYVNATIGQIFPSSGRSPLPPPEGRSWSISESGALIRCFGKPVSN